MISFDDFRKILNDEGVSPSIGTLNRVWSAIRDKLNPPITGSSIEECVAVWSKTLERFNAQRPILPAEKAAIGRAIQANESEPVKLALYGARFETGSESFNPAQHLSVHRVLDSKNFARFASIGAQEKRKREKPKETPVLPPMLEDQPKTFKSTEEALEKTIMTPEARAILEGMRKRGVIGG